MCWALQPPPNWACALFLPIDEFFSLFFLNRNMFTITCPSCTTLITSFFFSCRKPSKRGNPHLGIYSSIIVQADDWGAWAMSPHTLSDVSMSRTLKLNVELVIWAHSGIEEYRHIQAHVPLSRSPRVGEPDACSSKSHDVDRDLSKSSGPSKSWRKNLRCSLFGQVWDIFLFHPSQKVVLPSSPPQARAVFLLFPSLGRFLLTLSALSCMYDSTRNMP